MHPIFVKKFTLPDFQAKNFTPQKCVICNIVHTRYKSVNAFDISNSGIFVRIKLNFAVFEKKKKQINERKYVLSGEIYTTGKTFTLPPAVTGVTNITSGYRY